MINKIKGFVKTIMLKMIFDKKTRIIIRSALYNYQIAFIDNYPKQSLQAELIHNWLLYVDPEKKSGEVINADFIDTKN